jgi:type II secretory pathway component GspD/PulD (secretin)
LLAASVAYAGGGGGGGGGGFGGQRGGQATYTPPNQVGSAIFSVNADGDIIAVASEETLRQIEEVLKSLDRPQPQVLIKVVFLEVQHFDDLDIGVEGAWGKQINGGTNDPIRALIGNGFGASGVGTLFATNANSVGQPFGMFAPNGAGLYQVLGTDFQATLRAIAQAGKAQLLSRPSILARDGQPATIVIGQSIPLITSVSFTGIAGNPVNNITYQDVGIILRVTPYITDNGMVQMIIAPETSALNPNVSVTISPGVEAPAIDIRRADTVAITADGQTVVIGGLMASDRASAESKVPFLGDIPILGNLFKRQTRSSGKTELLIFLTPHIIAAPTDLAQLSRNEESRNTLIRKSVTQEEVDKYLEGIPLKDDSLIRKSAAQEELDKFLEGIPVKEDQ